MALVFRLGLACGEVGLQRCLGIDHHLSTAGQLDHEIGSRPALVAVESHLLAEIAVVEHARELDDATQLELSPASPHVGRLERLAELAGLALELAVGARDELEMSCERLVVAPALGLDALELLVHAREGVAQRSDERIDRRLALGELRAIRALERAETLARQRQEALARAIEGLGRERVEAIAQTPVHL
jgi:hypothetical protein